VDNVLTLTGLGLVLLGGLYFVISPVPGL